MAFIELASISLILGIYIAIKCSYMIRAILANHVSWSPKYIEIIAFALTFCCSFSCPYRSKITDWNYGLCVLRNFNKLAGGAFSILKQFFCY
jgi:membrane protein required for colicin V production